MSGRVLRSMLGRRWDLPLQVPQMRGDMLLWNRLGRLGLLLGVQSGRRLRGRLLGPYRQLLGSVAVDFLSLSLHLFRNCCALGRFRTILHQWLVRRRRRLRMSRVRLLNDCPIFACARRMRRLWLRYRTNIFHRGITTRLRKTHRSTSLLGRSRSLINGGSLPLLNLPVRLLSRPWHSHRLLTRNILELTHRSSVNKSRSRLSLGLGWGQEALWTTLQHSRGSVVKWSSKATAPERSSRKGRIDVSRRKPWLCVRWSVSELRLGYLWRLRLGMRLWLEQLLSLNLRRV